MPILSQQPSVFPENLLTGDSFTSDFGLFNDALDDRRWMVVYTRSRQEKSLARQLHAYEIPFYLPLTTKDRLSRGRPVQSYLPVFTGYLFLYGTETERVQMLTTNRVSQILPVHDQQQLARDLKGVAALVAADAPLTVERRLSPGATVRVKDGSLAGIEGLVIQRRGKSRLLVAVSYLQQGVSIEIEDFMVEPV